MLWQSQADSKGPQPHIHVSLLPQTPLPSRLPHNTEQSALCWTVRPFWLSILNTAACTGPFPPFFVFIFWWCPVICWILVPQTGINPVPAAGEGQSLNHGTTREVPITLFLKWKWKDNFRVKLLLFGTEGRLGKLRDGYRVHFQLQFRRRF